MVTGIQHVSPTAAADDPAYDVSADEWNEEHGILDLGTAFYLLVQSDSTNAFTANRILTVDLDNAARTLSLLGNLTVESASLINQDLTTDADATLNTIALDGGYMDISEIAAPGAGAANTLRLYVEAIHGFSFFSFVDDGGMIRKIVRDSVFVAYNNRGTLIAANRIVYATGSFGDVPTIDGAKADDIATMPAIGVTIEAIANNSYGRVMQVGLLENVNTNAFAAGDVLFVSDAVAGTPTATAPVTPSYTQEIGTVLVQDPAVGSIQIIARALTGDEYGTAQNTFSIGDGLATNKILTFNAAADASIVWDGTDFIMPNVSLDNSGLHILDTNATHDLIFAVGSDLTADRVLTLTTGDAARTITLSGNPTLNDWFDQAVKQASSPTFAGATFNGLTASRLVATGAGKALASADANSWISGTTNEIDVADDGDGTITLSLSETVLAHATQPLASNGNSYATIAAAETGLGGTGWIFIPVGTWSENVTFSDDDIIVFGAGWGTIVDGAAAGHPFSLTGDRIVVRDLQCKTTAGGGNNLDGIQFWGEDCKAINVYVSSSDRYGMYAVAGANRTDIISCLITGADSRGIYVNAPYTRVTQSTTLNCSDGIYGIGGGDNSVFVDNIIVDPTNRGIVIDTNQEDCIVDGNKITGFGIEAILDNSGTSTIGDNETT
jgi:hypothetical protein